MSDATLRELERATRDDEGGQAWARLALGRARAGLDGRRAAVQALLRDPAAPVRELLPRGDAPAPRLLAEVGPDPIQVPTGILRQPPTDVLDLGRGRALLVATDELIAVDLFGGAVLWRRARRGVARGLARPVVVGDLVVDLHEGRRGLRVEWRSATSGDPVGRLDLPGGLPLPRGLTLVELAGGRCALVARWESWRAVAVDLGAGRLLGTTALGIERVPDADDLLLTWGRPDVVVADGALVAGGRGALEAWEPDGRRRWRHETGADMSAPLAAGGGRVATSAGPRLDVVAADTGRLLSSVARGGGGPAVFAGQLLVFVEEELDGRGRLVACSPDTGESRWRADLTFDRGQDLALHAAGDVIVVVRSFLTGADFHPRVVETTGVDRDTGVTLWSRRTDWLLAAEGEVRPLGGLVVAIGPPSGWLRKHTPLRRDAPAGAA